jgi:hypothetical protein
MENIDNINDLGKHNLPHSIGRLFAVINQRIKSFNFGKTINAIIVGEDSLDCIAYDCFKNPITIIIKPAENRIGFGVMWHIGENDLDANDINDEDEIYQDLTERIIAAYETYAGVINIVDTERDFDDILVQETLLLIIELVIEADLKSSQPKK